jgi:hypothetical protein
VPGLPNGLFSNQKSQFKLILEGLRLENVYFMAIWNILQKFGIFYNHLVYFFPVLVTCTKKNLATLPSATIA